jgi:hypothetical protein
VNVQIRYEKSDSVADWTHIHITNVNNLYNAETTKPERLCIFDVYSFLSIAVDLL